MTPLPTAILSLPSSRMALKLSAALAMGCLIGLGLTGIAVDPAGLRSLVLIIAAAAGFAGVCRLAAWRLAHDPSRPAAFIRTAADRLCLGMTAFAAFALVTAPCALLSYLCLATSLPLQDAAMVAFDKSLGFDWTGVVSTINEQPVLRQLLALAYRSSIPQAVAIIFVLALADRRRELSEFLALFAVTSLATCVLSGLIPTEGAYYFLKPDPAIFANLDPSGGLAHHAVLTALREGTFPTFHLDDVKGLVTFPSFHTTLAIVVAYCGARLPYVGVPVVVLNLFVVASTMAEGGHYFADIAGGAAVAALAILLVRRINARVATRTRSGAIATRPATVEP